MTIRRVALIFDNRARPETTGGYCLRALQELVNVEHFLPDDLGRVPRTGIDLYVNIDDGMHYELPGDLHPSVWWAIDTHVDFAWCLRKARTFDCVFSAQCDGTAKLQVEGVHSSWLPLACDPKVHRPHPVDKRWDICFVGHVFPGPRADLLELLRQQFPSMFVGQCYFETMAQTYSGSRVVFNRSISNDLNMRVFEAMACGSLLLTNDLPGNGQGELFEDGKHLATYADVEELLYKANYYLNGEKGREKIAATGRQEVLAHHTYGLRMEKLLAEAEKQLSRTVVSARSAANGTQVPRNVQDVPPPSPSASVPVRYDPFYFECIRPELLALVPAWAARVLDVGCGAGRLGEALKARQSCHVIGIELVESAASAARTRLDEVLVGDVELMSFPFAVTSFDAIICGDVLEHLREPVRFLRTAAAWLQQDGALIASLPNVRHHSVVRGLLAGNWTYEAAGLLDHTHLQFFTRSGIAELFHEAGLEISSLSLVPGPGYEEWQQRGRPGEVRVGSLHIGDIAPEEVEEFYVYQYLVTANVAQQGKLRATLDAVREVQRFAPIHDEQLTLAARKLKSPSPEGKWDTLYLCPKGRRPYGYTLTYEKAARFLGKLATIEDWGCGWGWFQRYLPPSTSYCGIDGSKSPFADVVTDLTRYTSQPEGILLRHVLEHNEAWQVILANAVKSFTRRMALVLFTPFAEKTHICCYNDALGLPDISFAKNDLIRCFSSLHWELEEGLATETQYGIEHIFYIQRP